MEKTESILRLAASIILMPVFFVTFCLLYDPFGIEEYYTFGNMSYSFHLTMLGCIILLTYILTRIMYAYLDGRLAFSRPQSLAWFVAEMFACACFMALYTHLFRNGDSGWFQSLADCMKYSFLILCYPAAATALAVFHRSKAADGAEKRDDPAGEEESLVKLYDEHKRLKLTITPDAILYVRADANYVTIHYEDSGKAKEYLLRSSMKRTEESLLGFGIMRCHRSYLVNPAHIKMLGSGSGDFCYITLDVPGTPQIPVSKQYSMSIMSKL